MHQRRVQPSHLSAGAPNILIILLDDGGPGQAGTYGGEINTSTLSRVAKMGISYNRFHSTAMCSPNGKVKTEVETAFASPKSATSADITMKVNGKEFAKGGVPLTAPLFFTVTDCFDIGSDLGAPVALDYFDKAPFACNGKIDKLLIKYT